mgnify:CR=1 FL=1
MGIAIKKEGFATAGKITLDLINTLIANGFKAKFPVDVSGAYVPPTAINSEKFTVTLEATGDVDPLNKTEVAVKQPWRINFTVYDNATMGIVVGTPDSLPDTGALPLTIRVGGTPAAPITFYGSPKGVVGAPYTKAKNFSNPPPTEYTTCVRWSTGEINSLQLAGDHPNYGKNTIIQGDRVYTMYPFDESMQSPTTYPSFCVLKTVTTTDEDNADKTTVMPDYLVPTQGFINRAEKVWQGVSTKQPLPGMTGTKDPRPAYPGPDKDLSATLPLAYQLSISPRGLYIGIWQGSMADVSGTDFSWLLVQRPVHRDTGATVVEGKAPVFCVNSVGNVINRFIVRESDVVDSSANVIATQDTKDGTAIINDKKQIGVSENNQYVVNYPSRLNTPRFAYTYELDMIGYCSATVVSGTTEIPQTLYGEATPRTYIGMHSNLPANNGMRIVVLKAGGGIGPVTP